MAVLQERQRFGEEVGMFQLEPAGRPEDAELGVEHQESVQQVAFVPELRAVLGPVAPVVRGDDDVVPVDQAARFHARQDFEHLVVHVAADLADMTGVDEQDVGVIEDREVHVLYLFDDQPVVRPLGAGEEGTRIGFDASEVAGMPFGAVAFDGGHGDEGAVAAADFHHAARLAVTDQRIEDIGIGKREPAILLWRELANVEGQHISEQGRLPAFVHVDPRKADAAIIDVGGEVLHGRDRRVIVVRGDMQVKHAFEERKRDPCEAAGQSIEEITCHPDGCLFPAYEAGTTCGGM